MVIAARILRLLAFAVWMGGLVFFGAVVAPTAFHTFGATQLFAEFIARSLLMQPRARRREGAAARPRVRRALERVQVAEFSDWPVRYLSFGSRRKVEIGSGTETTENKPRIAERASREEHANV